MKRVPFRVAPLEAAHDRKPFSSGIAALDDYFQRRIMQDIRRKVTAGFVALTREPRIVGYYTLASTSLLLSELPDDIGKKLPRYPSVPAVRMGRLAVDQDFKGQGLGRALLADALDRAANSEIAAFALVVDAKDESAGAFYRHHGFIELPDSPLTLLLPLATVRRISG